MLAPCSFTSMVGFCEGWLGDLDTMWKVLDTGRDCFDHDVRSARDWLARLRASTRRSS